MNWFLKWFAIVVGSGIVFKLIDYLIEFNKESREQRRDNMTRERERPDFAVNVSKGETGNTNVPAVVVEILSLGSLKVTVHDGGVFIQTRKYPEGIQHCNLPKTDISATNPIKLTIPLPEKFVNSDGIREPSITIVVDFSYGKNNKPYHTEVPQAINGWYA